MQSVQFRQNYEQYIKHSKMHIINIFHVFIEPVLVKNYFRIKS
jgi:hypothetical protein